MEKKRERKNKKYSPQNGHKVSRTPHDFSLYLHQIYKVCIRTFECGAFK